MAVSVRNGFVTISGLGALSVGSPFRMDQMDGEYRESWKLALKPCPDGRPQRVCRAVGCRERNIAELELRVVLGGRDGGV
jgi:hypothetical protein